MSVAAFIWRSSPSIPKGQSQPLGNAKKQGFHLLLLTTVVKHWARSMILRLPSILIGLLWGKTTLTTWQSIIPARRLALITELLEHLPVQMINAAMKERMDELGKNQIVAMRDGKYDPPVAVNQVQDLVQFGLEFDIGCCKSLSSMNPPKEWT